LFPPLKWAVFCEHAGVSRLSPYDRAARHLAGSVPPSEALYYGRIARTTLEAWPIEPR